MVRLECPEELGRGWDGTIYAILQGTPKHLSPTDRSPFVPDDGQRSPGWECKLVFVRPGQVVSAMPTALRRNVDEIVWIPLWRLTHIHQDLISEIDERPLLTVFRFVRFSRFFVPSPGDPLQLVDDIDLIVEPGSAFICIVAIRHHISERHLVVAIPLSEILPQLISAEEFMLGYAHGQATLHLPGNFQRGWTALMAARPSNLVDMHSALRSNFPSTYARPVSGSRLYLDLGAKPVSYISPQGAVRHAAPAAFVLCSLSSSTSAADYDNEDDEEFGPGLLREPLGGPLLARSAAELTPLNDDGLVAICGGQAPQEIALSQAPTTSTVPADAVPGTQSTPTPTADAATSGVASSGPPAGLSASEQMLFAMLQEQREENRRSHEIAARQLEATNNQMAQFATALANVQQQFTSPLPQLQAPPLVPQLPTPADSQTPGAADFNRADRHPPRARAPERRGVAYDADDDDMNEERPRSPRGYIQARGLVDRADINDHARQARGRSASPHARRGRDRSSEHHRRSRSRSRDWFPMRSDRSRSRSRSLRSHLPRGNDRFRPSSNELRVHELAQVGPRQGTYDANLFSRADAQDRVRAMLQVEQFRRRYRATKVTTKMLFSVDFFTRPRDHFLQSADTTNSIEPRLVTHDSTQWSGAEQAPTHTIRRADQLHRALYAIQDAASVWYPDDLTRVFRAVHNNATHQVQPWASETVINAMCNLYSAVFASIFSSILSGTPLQLLEGLALQSMRRDSSEYQHYVGMVLNDAMLNSVFRAPGARPRERSPPRPRHGQRKPPGGTPTVIPPHIRSKIPTASGRSVCLRYQSMKDCDFPRCPHAHELVPLPGEVLKWLVDTHNSLKSDHPQS